MNFLTFFSKLKAIAVVLGALLPVIESAVQSAETALGPGNGSTKLQYVLDTVKSAFGAVQVAETTWEEIQPAVTNTVNSLVAAFNTLKAFSHGSIPPIAH